MKKFKILLAVAIAFLGFQKVFNTYATTYLPIRLSIALGLPIIIDTDLASGSTTNGEFSKGAYLKSFGYNFGTSANLGTSSGLKFYICGAEIDNYRALDTARISNVNAFTGMQRASVQVGSLGGATGACDVKMTVNGVDSNTLAGQFYVQPGHFWFADNVSGSDSTGRVDNIALPFRFVQNYTSGITATGLWAAKTTGGDNGIASGDTIVIRATGSNWVDNTGCDTNSPVARRWARFCGHTGTAPNGSAGNGYITFVNYPGPIKCSPNSTGGSSPCSSSDATGNAAEQPHFKDPTNGNGGIFGAQGANGYPNTPTRGSYVQISGLWIELVASSGSTNASGGDAAPINGSYGDHFWRVIDNELGPWPSTVTGANHAKDGGFTGQTSTALIEFNYIHDIGSTDANKENHCMYFDANSTDAASTNAEVAYNWITGCTGGSAIQFFDNTGGLDSSGHKVHHNYVDTWYKYGLNINSSTKSVDAYNNMFINGAGTGWYWIQMANLNTPVTINIVHNTVQIAAASSGTMINSDDLVTSGTIKINHNIIAMAPGRADHGFDFLTVAGSSFTESQNVWYDPDGIATAPTSDTTRITTDPKFINTTGNFRTLATGSGVDACTLAEAIAITTDLFSYARPVTGTGSPGAGPYNDVGAYEYH